MPGSNSVIRRYTPPTCTLEILAQSSPLSRWMGQTVLNQLRFELHFDDPALPEENKVTIQGDRDQIEALCNAVTNYVQELLQKSADSFCFTALGSQPSTTTSHQSELSELSERSELSELQDPHPTPSSSKSTNTSGMGILEATIYLETSENLTHKLYLGSLANQTSGPIIQLTLLQLFDLATALDEYATDVITLPNLKGETANSNSVFSFPTWTPVAAMVVLALGLTPLTWQYANNVKKNQEQTATNTQSSPEEVALEASPFAGLNVPKNLPSPTANSDNFNLPNLDSFTPVPESKVAQTPLSLPNSTVAPTIKVPSQNTQSIPRINQPVIPPLIPPSTTSNLQSNAAEVIKPSSISPDTKARNSPNQNSRNLSQIPESLTNYPNTLETFTPDNVAAQPDLQQLNRGDNISSTTTSLKSSDDLVARLRTAKGTTLPNKIAAEENQLFDSPQVAEARTFLQKNWQPPTGFAATLEYSLILGVDGTIERILPLNKAAREFVDNTGLPQIGQPFVSTNKAGQNLRLRVVFSPDGKVKTFAEKQ